MFPAAFILFYFILFHCRRPKALKLVSLRVSLSHGRPHIGVSKWGQLTPWKMDEKLKSENMQRRAVLYVYVTF